MFRAESRGELRFERLDLRPHDEALAVTDPRDRFEHLFANGGVLRVEIEHRDFHGHLKELLNSCPAAGRTVLTFVWWIERIDALFGVPVSVVVKNAATPDP